MDVGALKFFHFTHPDNLESILRFGLRTLGDLHKSKIPFHRFDDRRGDRDHSPAGAICISVGHPPKCFLAPRGNQNRFEYVILEIAPEFWEEVGQAKIAPTNSASREMILEFQSDGVLIGSTIYSSPFCSKSSIELLFQQKFRLKEQDKSLPDFDRSKLGIPDGMPTDPQSEVLVFDTVAARFIKSIHCANEDVRLRLESFPGIDAESIAITPALFIRRPDSAFWDNKRIDIESIGERTVNPEVTWN